MDDPAAPLHAMDPTGRFSDRAEVYARYRPSYPAGAIDAILEGLGEPRGLVCADVGAGTGISARLVAERGVRVIAVEPNEAMRRAATPHPMVEWRDGTAESTGLADGAVDLVVCAQAFHWFRQEEALAEFRRSLRERGRVALMWNIRDDGDPFTREYGAIIDRVSTVDWKKKWTADVPAVRGTGHFRDLRRVKVPYVQEHDADGLVGRAMCASYVPRSGPGHEQVVRELMELHRAHADERGRVRLVYNTVVYLAERGKGIGCGPYHNGAAPSDPK